MKIVPGLVIVGACALALAQEPPAEAPPVVDPTTTEKPAPAPTAAPPGNESAVNVPGTPEAQEVFGKMLDAFRRAQTLSFRSKNANSGSLAGRSPTLDVSVRMRRLNDRGGAWQLRVT